MQIFKNRSLKTRLVISFAGVVILASLISAVVFSIVLVTTMKKSSRDKIEETSKIARTHTDNISRGLEIYADLIASDMTFGQVLSFDSSAAISQKIEQFTKLSHDDVVGFVPRREQYVQIKNQVFMNSGCESLSTELKTKPSVTQLLNPENFSVNKGWMILQGSLFIYAMKSVSHFGSNMGVVFLGRKCDKELASELSEATGTDIALYDKEKVYSSTLSNFSPTSLGFANTPNLQENLKIENELYLSYDSPVVTDQGKHEASLALLSSNQSIQNARNQTLKRVILV